MAGSFTDTFENQVLNVLRATNITAPATVYVGLFTTATGETGGGTEVTGGSYARQAVTFGAPSGGAIANSADVTFPVATASWGTVTHIGIFDAVTAGNMLVWADLTASKTVASGDQVKFPAGNLTVSLN